ncbi:MAG TPA: glycosyltransferase family 2 protein [Bacteroidia bacterium]|jgi:glycosyltransferase involved in cell wall biosynthesis|nr:glycosyltransferase family 2 protein [Bacteroidia bacterium]
MKNRSLSVVIPAYNESGSIGSLLDKLIPVSEKEGFDIVVVNDCSKDNTLEILENHPGKGKFRLVSNKRNKGYGGAIKEGIKKANTDLVVTIDADGQHEIQDVLRMYDFLIKEDADMVVGSREGSASASAYRALGKSIIRGFSKILMPIDIYDINSGMKMYDRKLALNYMNLCPDGMPYSDTIALTFINHKHLVKEIGITIYARTAGKSTISTKTAFQTMMAVLNIVMLFNPLRIFLPLAILCFIGGTAWGLPIILSGRGVSVGALLAFITSLLLFMLGLIAEQLSHIRKHNIISTND